MVNLYLLQTLQNAGAFRVADEVMWPSSEDAYDPIPRFDDDVAFALAELDRIQAYFNYLAGEMLSEMQYILIMHLPSFRGRAAMLRLWEHTVAAMPEGVRIMQMID